MMGRAIQVLPHQQRKTFALRGFVESHGVRKMGIWPFQNHVQTIRVRIGDEQHRAFNQLCNEQMLVGEYGHVGGILNPLDIGVASAQEFPIGTPVAIIFGYANLVQQFFFRAEPLIVIDVNRHELDAALTDELVA